MSIRLLSFALVWVLALPLSAQDTTRFVLKPIEAPAFGGFGGGGGAVSLSTGSPPSPEQREALRKRMETMRDTTRLSMPSIQLRQLLAMAYRVQPGMISFKGRADGDQWYEVDVQTPEKTRSSALALLKSRLAQELKLEVLEKEEKRLVDVLQLKPGATEPMAAAGGPGQGPGAGAPGGGPVVITMGEGGRTGGPRAFPMSMEMAAGFLGRSTGRTVIDETGWKQRYNLNWSFMDGPEMLEAALLERGVELVPDNRLMKTLTVSVKKEK